MPERETETSFCERCNRIVPVPSKAFQMCMPKTDRAAREVARVARVLRPTGARSNGDG
jgi:hypothetical protein